MKLTLPADPVNGGLETYTTRSNVPGSVILRVRLSINRSGGSTFLVKHCITDHNYASGVRLLRSPLGSYIRSVLRGHMHTEEILLCGPDYEKK